jgi:hypothetical protein
MKLQTVDVRGVKIAAHDAPWGLDYLFQIRSAATGQSIAPRTNYPRLITRISTESLTPSCPSYRFAEITRQYELPVGTYIVQASRSPQQMADPSRPGPDLPEVASNAVSLTITP